MGTEKITKKKEKAKSGWTQFDMELRDVRGERSYMDWGGDSW